jgi:integrase
VSKLAANSLTKRKGAYYLRKTFEGRQREISLGTDLKTAKSRAVRFLATAESSGFDVAMAELRKKPFVKAGANPTFEEMAILYREFCQQSAKAPRPQTITHNLSRLKCLMARGEFKTVGRIDKSTLSRKWFGDKTPTPAEKRTFASAVSAAAGVFKKSALAYYKTRNIPIQNPFEGLEVAKPKVSPYVPISAVIREKIWKDCETELDSPNAMIVLMALGIGMRRAEIEAAIPDWFSRQSDRVLVHIREEDHFQTKTGESGVVPISITLYETLVRLRGESNSPYFVPSVSNKSGTGRIWERVRVVNQWLKDKGLNNRKPLHALRKECGSLVAKSSGILEASKVLRNTPQVCAIHYAGIAELNTVDVAQTFTPQKDLISQIAKQLGISSKEAHAKLGISNVT